MRPVPPANLVERLDRLHLATPAQVATAGVRVRKLAGELMEFESVWVDALAQGKVMTPWQAAEFNAGRGEQLCYGSYVLTGRLADSGFTECYSARHVDSRETVRLYVCHRPQRSAAETLAELKTLAARHASIIELPAVFDCGSNGASVWVACRVAEGSPARDWLAEQGRMAPAAVLQIARSMAKQLSELERQRLAHGDVCAAGLLLARTGDVHLPAPGLRGILRPHEGVGFADLRPDAYDYLAPERVANGSPPDVASDLYACGALWWHLLAGRSPLAGGNARAKLHAVQAARLMDIRSMAPGAPENFAALVMQCLSQDRSQRPTSFAQLAEKLGPPSDAGRELLASLLRAPTGVWQNFRSAPPRRTRRSVRRPLALGATSVAAILALATIPLLTRSTSPEPQSSGQQVASLNRAPSAAQSPALATPQTEQPSSEEAKSDPEVRPASANLPMTPPKNLRVAAEPNRVVEDLVLATGEILRLEKLDLEPRMRVRGRGGRRPIVSVPPQGLLVHCENVTFEGIDFIWQMPASADRSADASGAIIRLRAQTVHFRGCSFNARAAAPPAAIQTLAAPSKLGGFGCELSLTDCVFDGVRSVVHHTVPQSIATRVENCLCVASGPILSLARYPMEGIETQILLDHVTTRGDTSVLLVQSARGLGKPGPIAITASGCALAGMSRAGLISLVDAPSSDNLVQAIAWNGQGSVMSPRTPMLISQGLSGGATPLADDQLAVAGLVRGDLEFAGRADGPPVDSRVMRWQAPLRSAEPPGADPDRLHSLRSKREE